jgi:tetratricopeptide (TPR) repeat protein
VEAERAYGLIEAAAPNDSRAIYSLAVIDIRQGRLAAAAKRLRRAIRIDPNLGAAHHNLGYVSQRLGCWADAAMAYGRAVELDPDASASRLNLAIALAAVGRIDEAIDQYRRLAAGSATRADALTRLALLAPGRVTDGELEDLHGLAQQPGLSDSERTGLLFALGGVLDARGAFEAAFEAFVAGNALKRQALTRGGADPALVAAQNERAVGFVRRLLNAGFFAQHRAPGASKASPIFVVGFPRSGSTLIEQILASHGSVQGLGESPVLSGVLNDQFPYAATPSGPGHFRKLADAYLAGQRARGWDGRSRLVDKTLENYLHVGVIALMFPKAVILHSVREAADTGFACFRQLFVAGNETLYDLAQIGEEYVRYRGIMAHWDQVLPDQVIDIEYEALAASPDARIRWLVTQACGLDWDPACLRFDQAERGVTTASGAQVRRPIFVTSLGRWRPYARHLTPMLAALGPLAPKKG